jgi:hypothetical protein
MIDAVINNLAISKPDPHEKFIISEYETHLRRHDDEAIERDQNGLDAIERIGEMSLWGFFRIFLTLNGSKILLPAVKEFSFIASINPTSRN